MKFQLFRKNTRKVGQPPGTIAYFGAERDEKIQLNLISYDDASFDSKEISESEIDQISKKPKSKWLDVIGIHNSEILSKIGQEFDIHSLVLEDIANTAQQPKIEDYENSIYVALKMFYIDSKNEIRMEHINFVLKQDMLLSFQEVHGDVFEPVRKRLQSGRKKIRTSNSDYLLYALMDSVVDNYYLVIQKFGEKIDSLKKSITKNASQSDLEELDKLYEEILIIQNSVEPLKHIIPEIEDYDSDLFDKENELYFRDLQDHINQISLMVQAVKDKLSSMNDYYLAVVSNRTNEVMKTLALVATICVPITVIAGIYGMNFQYMPELESPYSYPIVLSAMAAIGGGLYGYFKKKRWV